MYCLSLLVTIIYRFFVNDTATTEIYTYGHTLALHDALPISYDGRKLRAGLGRTYGRDEEYRVFIRYTAMPDRLEMGGSEAISQDKGLCFTDPRDEDPEKPFQI